MLAGHFLCLKNRPETDSGFCPAVTAASSGLLLLPDTYPVISYIETGSLPGHWEEPLLMMSHQGLESDQQGVES